MSNETKSSPVLVFIAWLFVGIPSGWGVYNTVHNSMKLFQQPVGQPAATIPAK